jgi:tetratricopeptide (TPR) repeat protein
MIMFEYFTSSLEILTQLSPKSTSILTFLTSLSLMRKLWIYLFVFFVVFTSLCAPCWADPHEDVLKMLKQDLTEQAFTMVNAYLQDHPQDPQMRFWQGNLWVKKGESNKASEVFLRLTQDYPELSEPYNNLGILQFQAGDFLSAKSSFESALKVQPDFVNAMENLGDTYLLLARSTLDQAKELDPKSKSTKYKLELIGQLLSEWSRNSKK